MPHTYTACSFDPLPSTLHPPVSGCLIQGEVPGHIRAAAQRSQEAADLRAANEEAVAAGKPADANLLAAYMAYIAVSACNAACALVADEVWVVVCMVMSRLPALHTAQTGEAVLVAAATGDTHH